MIAVLLGLALGLVAATAAGTTPCRPLESARGAVRWGCRPRDLDAHAHVIAARVRSPRGAPFGPASRHVTLDSLRHPLVRAAAFHVLAARSLAAGDTTGAESLLVKLARLPGIWGWETARRRAEIALARADTAGADRQLESADRRAWPDPERAEWLAMRIGLRAALGDTASALTFARQGCRRYAAAPAAASMLAALERQLAMRGETLTPEDQRAAADVDYWRGDRASAAARLARAFAAWPPGGRARVGLRQGEVLRELRRFPAAQEALRAALAVAGDAGDRARILLEQARVWRDAGRPDSTFLAYARASDAARDTVAKETATWEWARELERAGRWREARARYAHVAASGPRRREEARLRAALVSLALDEPAEGLRWCEQGTSESARFWRGILLRRVGSPEGERVLASVAARPGYSFYASAARDTLGLRSPRVPAPADPPRPAGGAVSAASLLAELAFADDAMRLLERWASGDPRLADPAASRDRPAHLLAAAHIAYRAGRYRTAIRLSGRALEAQADAGDSSRWSIVPWAFPPAFDSLFAVYPESAAAGRLDRALLQALAWKESAFDPRARSRSDAIGLLQLQRSAGTDVAGWLHERPPSDSALADPALNLRYGARYLERQLARFPGDLPLALAAYNAGPTVARRWKRLRALGGDALACEEIDYPETQDYVKTVLAVRQAYRELRPTLAR